MEKYIKYPLTVHLPWSDTISTKDKVLSNINHFKNKEVVVTEKIDGVNISLYSDYIHSKKINMESHSSYSWILDFHKKFKKEIPNNIRICGEYTYPKLSVKYDNLKSFFYVISIWDTNQNICLSWDETVNFSKYYNIPHIPVLYDGMWSTNKIKSCYTKKSLLGSEQEGYVVRVKSAFKYDEFKSSVAKYVKSNFEQKRIDYTTESYSVNKQI